MTNKEIRTEFTKQLERLEVLKALAHKYDKTELELSSDEWESIKLNRIDKRDWIRSGQTSDEFYNEMIKTTKSIINNYKN